MKNHTMANEYKILCSESNNMSKRNNIGRVTSNGWTVVDNEYNKRSNFKGVLYEKGGQYAICFVGTDRTSAKDWGANLKMVTTGDSTQIKQAQKFAEKMIQRYPLDYKNTVSIGHSEGGTEATEVGIQTGFQTVTFNAYGISKKHVEPGKNYDDLVTNYRDPHDPVSKMKANVGTTYIVPEKKMAFIPKMIFRIIKSHRLKNMGDCNLAVLQKESITSVNIN